MYTTAKDGLVTKLNDVFGVGGKGSGIDFNDTTTAGPLSRVFVWTPDFLTGTATDVPVERLNEWVTTISIDDKVVGFATIWINDSTVEPELATFTRGLALGTALLTVPADATLVRDDLAGAWFTLTGAALAPLDPGTSGVDAVTPLASYQRILVGDRPTDGTASGPNPGLVFGGITLGAVIVLVAATLVLLSRRRVAALSRADAVAPVAPTPAPPTDVPTQRAAPVETATPVAKPPVAKKPVAKKPASKPVSANPVSANPASAKLVPAKPTIAKPATAKPTIAKPATAKPTIAKPATAKPATAKPATAPKANPARAAAAKSATAATKPATATAPKKPAARKPTTAKPAPAPEQRSE